MTFSPFLLFSFFSLFSCFHFHPFPPCLSICFHLCPCFPLSMFCYLFFHFCPCVLSFLHSRIPSHIQVHNFWHPHFRIPRIPRIPRILKMLAPEQARTHFFFGSEPWAGARRKKAQIVANATECCFQHPHWNDFLAFLFFLTVFAPEQVPGGENQNASA